MSLGIIDENGTTLATLARNSQSMIASFTISETKQVYLFCFIPNGSVINNYEVELQVEKGSTKTTYEPYIGSSYPIYLGVENLLDSDIDIERTLSNYGNVNITLNSACTLQAGTYTLSFDAKSDANSGRHLNKVNFYNTNTLVKEISFYKAVTTNWQRMSVNVVFDSATTFTTIPIQVAEGGTYYFKDFQLEKGSKANSFTPYGVQPIELCKIGTYQDYIYKENGSWYLHKEIGKVVLDGSESWYIRNDVQQTGYTCFRNGSYVVNSRYTGSNITNVYCNYFVVLAQYTGQPMIRIINATEYGETIMFPSSIASTEADFKTWLSSHNTILYYVLPTPTNTEITDTTLISQLESLSS